MLLAVLFLAALILSISHPWSHAYIGDAQYGDAAYWDVTAESWARGYVNAKAPDIRPGYSVFLGIIYSLFGADFRFGFVAQAVLYALAVAMVYLIGRQISGRMVGALAAALLVLDPYMWEWTATSTTEILGSTADLAALLFILRALRGPRRWGPAAASAACLALANVVRPITLPFLAVIVVAAVACQSTWKWRAAMAVATIGAAMLMLAPALYYEYVTTGEAGLSSDSAANLFAASSPDYGTWTPAIYQDVSAQLTARGVTPTAEHLNAEFTRLTIQNYLRYPLFQVRRITDALRSYGGFEGELERPEQYGFFYRPFVVAGFALVYAGMAVATTRGKRGILAALPGCLLAVSLLRMPALTLAGLQALGWLMAFTFSALAVLRRSRGARAYGALVIALFWLATGLLAIVSTGIVGFFLNRLYTQVEPERTLLLALGATSLSLCLVPRQLLAHMVSARWVTRHMPRLPSRTRLLAPGLAAVSLAIALLGGGRLVLANVAPPEASSAFVQPSAAELGHLSDELGLPDRLQYLTPEAFAVARPDLVSGKLQSQPGFYAVPGEFMRFLWYLSDQDRTLFWYIVADHTRPASLDLTRITAESVGRLTDSQFGNHTGLLILVVDSPYFDATGDVTQQNVLTARAFVPWDEPTHQFRVDAPIVFPLSIPLYGHARFEVAQKTGTVAEAGPLRVVLGDRLLRALSFQPDVAFDQGGRQSAITYQQVWVPNAAHFQAWVALHPRLFGNPTLGPVHVRISLTSGTGVVQLIDHALDPLDVNQRTYAPLDVDLTPFGGQTVDVQIQVVSGTATGEGGEVLVAEPRLLVPR